VEDPDALFADFERLGLQGSEVPRLQGSPEDGDHG
jgi:hypothetical protein